MDTVIQDDLFLPGVDKGLISVKTNSGALEVTYYESDLKSLLAP